MEKVMLGMSGGVDSSVAALILKEQGYDVLGTTLKLHPFSAEPDRDINDAKAVCERMKIEHKAFDLSEQFKRYVTDNFINEYISGGTPNPCIECNKYIKFGEMLNLAADNGCEKIATGHYARIVKENGKYLLYKAKDVSKDQSYVLYMLTQEVLSKTLFPLGELTKEEARWQAEENGFVNANKKDSQDICFVPDGDYASFIERNSDFKSKKGSYIDISGNYLGEHKGIINYTIGQRKGLGIALGKHAFVLDKNAQNNEVTLGDEEHLFYKKVIVTNVNFIPFDKLEDELKVSAKLRYRQKEQPAIIKPLKNGDVLIEFDEPQRAPSMAQSAVFYIGDMVVGGGKILRGER